MQAPGESSATLPTPSPSDEDDSSANMCQPERNSSRCVGIEPALAATKSLEKCFKAVKDYVAYFAYRSSNGVCYEQPKPWSECRRIKRGPYDFYNMKAAKVTREFDGGELANCRLHRAQPRSDAGEYGPRANSSRCVGIDSRLQRQKFEKCFKAVKNAVAFTLPTDHQMAVLGEQWRMSSH